LGFMFASGKPVYGYTSATATYRDRVAVDCDHLVERNGQIWDRDGLAVENFGLGDNLMIARAIADSGGILTAAKEETDQSRTSLASFTAFRDCLEAMRQRVGEVGTFVVGGRTGHGR